jgi:UDP-glucose 4-epimerase
MKILITGGLGYIGSHLIIGLLNLNYHIDIIDDLTNNSHYIYKTIKYISKKEKNIKLYNFNLNNLIKLENVFKKNKYHLIIHTAFLNTKDIILNYTNNLSNFLNLINVMNKYNIRNLILSSNTKLENKNINELNDNNKIKSIQEEILNDLYNSNSNWKIIILRYSSIVGVHESGLLFYNNNFLSNIILQLSNNKNENILIKNVDKIKDYLHISDLINAHICAIYNLFENKNKKYFNLFEIGKGVGANKLEFIVTLKKITKQKLNYIRNDKFVHSQKISYITNIQKTKNELSWKPVKTIYDICYSYYNYLIQNQNDNLKKFIQHHYTME